LSLGAAHVTIFRMKAASRNIPSLDGLRAISVLMVLSNHMGGELGRIIPFVPHWIYTFWGTCGVQAFFVISGFLITHLLLKEWSVAGTISLKRFYLRRAFRIFPPLYAYLAVAMILTLLGVFPGYPKAFLVAATYTWNYHPGGSEILLHMWTLSLEEQFYLLWPPALLLLAPRKCVRLAIWLILLSPVSRIVTYFLMPAHRESLIAMLHSGLDTIMFGCLLALLWRNPSFNKLIGPFVRGWVAALAASFALVGSPVLQFYFRGSYGLVFGVSLTALCLSLILVYVVRIPDSALGRLLNTRALRHIGVISYSVYLWQQVFTRANSSRIFPWNIPAIFLCAELSYWIVERPSFRLRDRVECALNWKRKTGERVTSSAAGSPTRTQLL
jgi:peptidoglycan/LPS O-acetylase OafA/YrhL